MIVGAIIALIVTLVGAAFSILPTSTLGVLDTTAATIGNAFRYAGNWDGFFPILDILQIAATVLTVLLPGILIYKLANWLYKHIPQIGGFGPGSG